VNSMKILILRHYPMTEGPSMKAFADQLVYGLMARGHSVAQLTAPTIFGRLLHKSHPLSKWLGYIDQFVLFPPYLWFRTRFLDRPSLTVLSDQALGPWLFSLHRIPTIVHCHDLLALESAQGYQPYNKLGLTGKIYQSFIYSGFLRAPCFISVSESTRQSLEAKLDKAPLLSTVIYNPLPDRFHRLSLDEALSVTSRYLPGLIPFSFILHIGRNWYKNRMGVLAIWEHLSQRNRTYPLVLVGALDTTMLSWLESRPHMRPNLYVLESPPNDLIIALYSLAACLLFPSHSEGFGWPILEAIACGCPVITTNRAPMTEVGGSLVTYLPPAPPPPYSLQKWAFDAALTVESVLIAEQHNDIAWQREAQQYINKFNHTTWLDHVEKAYQRSLLLQSCC
jgi:glycosyltransferase involved in cell wall biosynthesis